MRWFWRWVGLGVVGVGCFACGSDDDGPATGAIGTAGGAGGGGAVGGELPGLFAGYCSAKLLVTATPLTKSSPVDWTEPGAMEVAAGTTFLLGDALGQKAGFVFSEEGKPARLQIAGKQSFAKEGAFESDCPGDALSVRVLLAEATLQPNQDLSGEPCVVPAGTQLLGDYRQASGSAKGDPQTIESGVIEQLCGFSPGYAQAFPAARIYPKK